MRISDWSSDVCSSDLRRRLVRGRAHSRFPNRRGLALTTGLRAPEASLLGRDVDVDAVGAAGGVRSAESPCAGFRRLRNDDHVRPSMDEPDVFTRPLRSEEHKSELQSLMRISYAVFCLKKKIT